MNKRLCIVTAAALAVSGMALAPSVLAQPDQPAQPGQPGQVGQPGERPGQIGQPGIGQDRAIDRPGVAQQIDREQVTRTIARITDAALSEQNLRGLGQYLTQQDRQRLEQQLAQEDQQLQQSVQRLRQVWRERYNSDFNIREQQLAFGEQNLRVIPADSPEAARLAAEWIGPDGDRPGMPDRDRPGIDPETPRDPGAPGAVPGAEDPAVPGARPGQPATPGAVGDRPGQPVTPGADREIGRPGALSGDRVTVFIREANHAPPVLVNLVREPGVADATWTVDLPQQVDAQKLRTKLREHIGMITEQPDRLPQDQEEGYVMVSHHVLAALTDARAGTHPGLDHNRMDRPGMRDRGNLPGTDTQRQEEGMGATPR